MDITILLGAAGILVGSSGVYAWFKLGPERRQIEIHTTSTVLADLQKSYDRVSDELAQSLMRLKACEAENESCRQQVHEMQQSVALLTLEIARQSRLSVLARARAHVATKTLLSYELHIDVLLDEMRKHHIHITPMMRTRKLREAFEIRMERLEQMEAQELEQLLTKETETPPSEQ